RGASRICTLALGGSVARSSLARGRPLAPALLPVRARSVGALLRADSADAFGRLLAAAPALEARARGRRARLVDAAVRARCSRGRARVRAARPDSTVAADRCLGARAVRA